MMKRLLFVCAFIFAAAATFAVDIGTALDQAAEQFSSTLQTGTTVAIVGIASDTDDMSEYMLDEFVKYSNDVSSVILGEANIQVIDTYQFANNHENALGGQILLKYALIGFALGCLVSCTVVVIVEKRKRD